MPTIPTAPQIHELARWFTRDGREIVLAFERWPVGSGASRECVAAQLGEVRALFALDLGLRAQSGQRKARLAIERVLAESERMARESRRRPA